MTLNIIFLQKLQSMHIYKNAYDYFNIFSKIIWQPISSLFVQTL